MASLAAAFENPQAQLQVVEEVKQALQRATVVPESQEKHERIGALANIVRQCFEKRKRIKIKTFLNHSNTELWKKYE